MNTTIIYQNISQLLINNLGIGTLWYFIPNLSVNDTSLFAWGMHCRLNSTLWSSTLPAESNEKGNRTLFSMRDAFWVIMAF